MEAQRRRSSILSPTNGRRESMDSPAATKKMSSVSTQSKEMTEAMEYVKSMGNNGPSQFKEDFECRYCGTARMALLGKGLGSKQRRALASQAVQAIGKIGLGQVSIRLRISESGITALSGKSGNGLFFNSAGDIQYLLAGRKASKSSNSTYVLLFAKDIENERKMSVVHLLRFSKRHEATTLYHAVHRMIRDHMFSTLFDIHSEADQESFNPAQILGHASQASENIEKFMAESMMAAMEKIDSVLMDGNSPSRGSPSNRRRSSGRSSPAKGRSSPMKAQSPMARRNRRRSSLASETLGHQLRTLELEEDADSWDLDDSIAGDC